MDPKLDQLSNDNGFRRKIAAIMNTVAAHGTETYIVSGIRTWAEEEAEVAAGHSQTMHSFHLPHGSDQLSYAADIVPKESGYQAPKWFWLLQAHVAMSFDLGVGILFGAPEKEKLVEFLKAEPFDPHAWEGEIGWDPSHIQNAKNW